MSRAKAEPVVHIDDGRFKVTEWRFAPGAETGWHIHGHDYVIVPLTDGRLDLGCPTAARRAPICARAYPIPGAPESRTNVVNGGDAPLAFLEVEAVESDLSPAVWRPSTASWAPGTPTTSTG